MPAEKGKSCLADRHWSELLFLLLIILGATVVVLDIKKIVVFPPNVLGAVFIGTSFISLCLIWKLTMVKRMTGILTLLNADLEVFQKENDRAQGMQAEKKAMDEKMADDLQELESAQMLLKGSENSLDHIKKQNEQMNAERAELLKDRRELAVRMLETMDDLNTATLALGREEMAKRVLMYFQEYATKDDQGVLCMKTDSWEHQHLLKMLRENHIWISDEGAGAGSDGELEEGEFANWLDYTMDYHFEKLGRTLERTRELTQYIEDLKEAERVKKKAEAKNKLKKR